MKTLKLIWNIVSSVLVALVVIVAILLVGVRLVGLQVFTVLSGSMEPTYQVGSLIYVKQTETGNIAVGDPITFMMDENTVATHRVIEIVPDEENPSVIRYRTQGDANDNADASLVHSANVIGVPQFSIPYLGYLANYIQNPPGTYIAIMVSLLLVIMVFIPDILFSSDSDKKTQELINSIDVIADDKPEEETEDKPEETKNAEE